MKASPPARPPLRVELLRRAFGALDARLEAPLTLIVGGRHRHDAGVRAPRSHHRRGRLPARGRLEDIAPQLRAVARELGLAPDWVNPHGVPGALDAADFLDDIREEA